MCWRRDGVGQIGQARLHRLASVIADSANFRPYGASASAIAAGFDRRPAIPRAKYTPSTTDCDRRKRLYTGRNPKRADRTVEGLANLQVAPARGAPASLPSSPIPKTAADPVGNYVLAMLVLP